VITNDFGCYGRWSARKLMHRSDQSKTLFHVCLSITLAG
jgi:hypothetical protein